jgi:hypothetical protein
VSVVGRSLGRVPGVAWALGVLLTVYVTLGWVFEHEAEVRGLLSSGGTPNLEVIAVGGAYLLVRLVVRIGVPLVVALAIAGRVAVAFASRARSRGTDRPVQ